MAEAKRKVLTAQTKVDEAGKQARIAEESLSDLESNEKQWQTQAELLSDTDSRMIILQGKQRDIAGIGADFASWKDEERIASANRGALKKQTRSMLMLKTDLIRRIRLTYRPIMISLMRRLVSLQRNCSGENLARSVVRAP